jgi:6-phosphogluconolactonase
MTPEHHAEDGAPAHAWPDASPTTLPWVVYATVAGSGELVALHAGASRASDSERHPRGLEVDGLREVQRLKLGGAPMPMAFSPDRKRLYVADRSPACRVHTLAIDPRQGTLTELGTATLAGNIAYVSATRDGRFLLTASYEEDFVAVNAVNEQGIAGEVLQCVPTPRHAHAILPDPSDEAVWVTCLSADVILKLKLDAQTGRLGEIPLWAFASRAQSGPRHMVFHPNARWCFVVNERDGSVDTLTLAQEGRPGFRAASMSPPMQTATVSLMDEGLSDAPWSAELRLSQDGRWLFASERRAGTLTAICIDPSSGALKVAHRLVVDTLPRSLAVSPDGTRLYVVGQQSGKLTAVAFDRACGHMRIADALMLGSSPTWVETLGLGV